MESKLPGVKIGTILLSEDKTYTGRVKWIDSQGWPMVVWDKWKDENFTTPLFSLDHVTIMAVPKTQLREFHEELQKAIEALNVMGELLDDTNEAGVEAMTQLLELNIRELSPSPITRAFEELWSKYRG